MMKVYISSLIALHMSIYAINIDDAIQAGLKNNQSLQSKKLSIETAMSRAKESAALNGVNFSLMGDLGKNKSSITYEKITNPSNQQYMSYGYGFNISKPIINIKNIRIQDRYELDIKRAEADFLQAKQDFIMKCSEAYLNALLRMDQIKSKKLQLEYWEIKHAEQKRRYTNELISKPQMLEATAMLERSKSDLMATKNAYNMSLASLRAMLGIEIDRFEDLPEDTLPKISNIQSLEKWSENSTVSYIGHIKDTIAAQGYKIDATSANAEKYPTLDAQLYAKADSTTDGVYGKTESDRYYAGLSLRWTLYNGGGMQARRDTAILSAKEIESRLAQSREDVSAQVATNYYSIESSRASYVALLEMKTALELNLKSAQKQYDLNLNSIVELYEAKIKLNDNELELKKNLYSATLAYLQLNYYSGSLDELLGGISTTLSLQK